jgi:hypothetical protein
VRETRRSLGMRDIGAGWYERHRCRMKLRYERHRCQSGWCLLVFNPSLSITYPRTLVSVCVCQPVWIHRIQVAIGVHSTLHASNEHAHTNTRARAHTQG